MRFRRCCNSIQQPISSLMKIDTEFLIIGSGLPGSLLALVLARAGRQATVVERGRHPRFAIGESSTPTADLYLQRLGTDFDVPEIVPLSTYATTRSVYPELVVGRKRGFSYFHHQRHVAFDPRPQHEHEMIVAARSSDDRADSHWLRSDIDAFVVSLIRPAGGEYLDQSEILDISPGKKNWQISASRRDEQHQLTAAFIVDATGRAGLLPKLFGHQDVTNRLQTETSTLFAHFEGIEEFGALHPDTSDHPFACDDAAVHHVLEDCWMWQLRFHTGLTSCGFCWPRGGAHDLRIEENRLATADSGRNWLREFEGMLCEYPTLCRQFESARAVTPKAGAFFRPRVQHLFDFSDNAPGIKPGWCTLPGTVGFVDPLHSTGLAHAISGVYRLAALLLDHSSPAARDAALRELMQQFYAEVLFLDRLIWPCYWCLTDFRAFQRATFWYFVAATLFEKRLATASLKALPFLSVDEMEFQGALRKYTDILARIEPANIGAQAESLEKEVRTLLAPFDRVGLFDPDSRNMFCETAVEAPSSE